MSRLKSRRQSRLKLAIISSAIAIFVGIFQNKYTYAWFTDSETTNSDLVITMGKMDVDVEKGFNQIGLNPGDQFNHNFKIKNNGTLKQNLRLYLDSTNKDILQYINCEFSFYDYKSKSINYIKMSDLINKEKTLNYSNGDIVVLDPQQEINVNLKVSIDNDIPDDALNILSQGILQIDLKIIASQVNSSINIKNNGFTDIAIQNNYLQLNGILITDESKEEEIEDLNNLDDLEQSNQQEEIKPPKEEVNKPVNPDIEGTSKEEIDKPNNLDTEDVKNKEFEKSNEDVGSNLPMKIHQM